MALRIGPLALAAAVAAAGCAAPVAAAQRAGSELLIENAERGRAFHFPLRRSEVFSVVYQHSMYDQPVTEDFVVDEDGRIVLQAVTSPSAAVREYFGITSAGERHAVVRAMREVVFRLAEGTPQRLRLGGVERSFLAFGEPGDRLVMRANP